MGICISKSNKAFTLLESLIGIVLVGIAVTALLVSTHAFTDVNAAGIELSTSEYLIEQIRELSSTLEVVDPQSGENTFGAEESDVSGYDDLDDFNSKTFSPPIDIDRLELTEFAGLSQRITVENVNPADLSQAVDNHSTSYVKVTVEILKGSEVINSSSWLRCR